MNGYRDFSRECEPAPACSGTGEQNFRRTMESAPSWSRSNAGSGDPWNGQVEFVDGGTQGLALLGQLAGRRALIILDALTTGAVPGTIHRLTLSELRSVTPVRGASAHEGNAGELLNAAQLLGELPDRLFIVGVEPQEIRTGFGLTSLVQEALPAAAHQVTHLLSELC